MCHDPWGVVGMPGQRYSDELIVAKLQDAETAHGHASASRGVQETGVPGADVVPLSSRQLSATQQFTSSTDSGCLQSANDHFRSLNSS